MWVVWLALVLSALASALTWLARRYALSRVDWRSLYVLSGIALAVSALIAVAACVLVPSVRRRLGEDVRGLGESRKSSRALFWAAVCGTPVLAAAVALLSNLALSRTRVSFFAPTRVLLSQILLVTGAVVLLGETGSAWMYSAVALLLAGLACMVAHSATRRPQNV